MKIEKVNDNQIRCTLTREDLASRELKLSELAYGTEKAKSLFRDMMQQANFEFGFEAEDIPLMIEAIPLNAECIVLIITKVEDPDELDTRFSRFAPPSDDDDSEEAISSHSEDVMDLFRKLQKKEDTQDSESSNTSSSDNKKVERPLTFCFPTLSQVMSAASRIAGNYAGLSTLYKNPSTGNYLLVLTQKQETLENFERACNTLSEYASLQPTAPLNQAFFEEHYEALILQDAIEALSNS